jgi:hypothetical protein
MIQLFDSVMRGYPIGSLLIWQTDREDITSLDEIGPIALPSEGPRLRSYVVDGHQRLATLLGVLKLPESFPRDRRDDWRWWIAYDLRGQQFVHVKDRSAAIPMHFLPLRSVLRTVEFARRTREMMASGLFEDAEAETLLDRADIVQKTIREYRIPLTVMRSGSLDDAVTIFARVNQRGRDMTPDQMVSALTFRDRAEGDFDLAFEIDGILGSLRAFGFGDLQRRTVLQVILALAGLDFTRPSYERIVDRSSVNKMRPAVHQAHLALQEAVQFLSDDLGVRTSRLLPYASIMVMLAIFFNEARDRNIRITQNEKDRLRKWFWATSFNGWFAGANTTEIRQAGDAMRQLASSDGRAYSTFSEFFFSRSIRPFPQTFDRRSARVRASLLVQMIVGRPRAPKDGEVFDGSSVFADSASGDLPYFFPNQRRPAVSNPANRVILPEGYARNARGYFLNLGDRFDGEQILSSHFVDPEAFDALAEDNFEAFIASRERSILVAEQAFLNNLDLRMDTQAARNFEEVDTDE